MAALGWLLNLGFGGSASGAAASGWIGYLATDQTSPQLMLKKNVASQKWMVYAFDRTDGTAKTGDAANISANIRKDWAAAAATNDTAPTELEDGYYTFDLTQAETNADVVALFPQSSTSNIHVVAVPATVLTVPQYFPDQGIISTGQVGINWADVANPTTAVDLSGTDIQLADTVTTNTDMRGTDSAATASALATAQADLDIITGASGVNLLTATQASIDAIEADTADMQPKLGTPAADVSADIAAVKVDTAATLVDTNELQGDWTNGGRLDLLIDAIKAVTDALPDSGALTSLATAAALTTVDTEVGLIQADLDNATDGLGALKTLIDALNDISVADILTTAMTEAYSTDGAAPTLTQALMLVLQILSESSVSGTTLTVKKLDGSTSAATFTLDDGTTPTSITRAS